jgi:hypothetical protein
VDDLSAGASTIRPRRKLAVVTAMTGRSQAAGGQRGDDFGRRETACRWGVSGAAMLDQ